MVTREEFNALMELLQRTPMSRAEALWVQVFVARLQAAIVQRERQRASVSGDDEEVAQEAQREGDDSA